jgi:hypothetical protein
MTRFALALVAGLCVSAATSADLPVEILNPAIDMNAFLRAAQDAAKHRSTHRLTEVEFIRLSKELGTVVLDARSREKFELLHIKRAVNLSFPDITVESLNRLLPDKSARVLIYCNNNFKNAEEPFPTKMPAASLNLSTYVALYAYGYRNVYELGPQLDASRSNLTFESSVHPPK